jgi:glycosyltransferase involved in cell wall biosynthesis
MKILMCNSFYYLRGGSERCVFDLSQLLRDHGHEVIPFAMADSRNKPSPYSEYFVSNIDFPSRLGNGSSMADKFGAVERTINSREAQQKIEQLIIDTKPEIAHVHGIAHEISPSILPVIKSAGIPVVQTLHDFKLICPNTSFISHGQVCERCKKHRYYNVVLNRCKRNSLAASFLAGLEMTIHKVLQIYEHNVDVFITPSQFLKDKLREYGINNQIVHLPNFLRLEHFTPCFETEDYFLYFGRLAPVKGVQTLLRAMNSVKTSKLYIVGAGELGGELQEYADDHNLDNVEFLGHFDLDELVSLIQRAAFTIMPSEGYDNYPMSVLESMACGTPVIGSRIGGIPEQIQDGYNGLLFEPGNAAQLAEKINYLLDNPQQATAFGRNGRRRVEEINAPEVHYRQTLALYESLLENS